MKSVKTEMKHLINNEFEQGIYRLIESPGLKWKFNNEFELKHLINNEFEMQH